MNNFEKIQSINQQRQRGRAHAMTLTSILHFVLARLMVLHEGVASSTTNPEQGLD